MKTYLLTTKETKDIKQNADGFFEVQYNEYINGKLLRGVTKQFISILSAQIFVINFLSSYDANQL